MQRRCQEVIDRCWALGPDNPILSIHDVGAGGLSNALPELLHGSGRGGRFELRQVPSDEPGMSPLELWCNEAQERYVLALAPGGLDRLRRPCAGASAAPSRWWGRPATRPTCRSATPTSATAPSTCRWRSCSASRRGCSATPARCARPGSPSTRGGSSWPRRSSGCCACRRWRTRPSWSPSAIASVTGLVARDQMVGPWQVPVADAAVTVSGYDGPHRRGDGHRRAPAGGAARRRRLRPAGGGRGDHQPRLGAGRRACRT